MKRSVIVLACLALAACEGQGTSTLVEPVQPPARAVSVRTVYLDQPFQLRVGESVVVNGESLTVTMDAVPEDSRCPTGLQCLWAGNARVSVTLARTGQAAQSFDLNTTLDPKTATYLDYQIELVALDPYPTSRGGPIGQSKYRATFVVRKAAA